jgi:hypothetical protein
MSKGSRANSFTVDVRSPRPANTVGQGFGNFINFNVFCNTKAEDSGEDFRLVRPIICIGQPPVKKKSL